MPLKKMTMKYWNSLSADSRYRALRKVFSNFSEPVLRTYSQTKAKDLDWEWDLIVKHVKQSDSEYYKTVIDHTYIP